MGSQLAFSLYIDALGSKIHFVIWLLELLLNIYHYKGIAVLLLRPGVLL